MTPIVTAPVFHVQLGVFETLTGYSPDAVQKMIRRGEWREGVHYRRRNGRVLVDLRAYNEWVENLQPAEWRRSAIAESSFISASRGSAAGLP